MSDYKAWFDGHDLSTLFVISPPERDLVTWEPTMAEAVIGAVPTGTKAQPMEITLRLTTFAGTLEQRLADLRTLSKWLAVQETKPLLLSDEMIGSGSCLLRLAMPNDVPKVTHTLNAATAAVKFICPDPRAYLGVYPPPLDSTVVSRSRIIKTCSFDSDTAYMGTLDGTAPTDTVIRLMNVMPDSNRDIEVVVTCYADDARSRILEGYGGTITLNTYASGAWRISIGSEFRSYSVSPYEGVNIILPLPLDQDWIRVIGGHPIKIEVTKGTCSTGSYLSYTPRWW